MHISSNFDEVITALDKVADDLPEANEAAVHAATGTFDLYAEDRIAQIYRQPEPESVVRRGGRTGQLRTGRTMTIQGSGENTTGVIDIQGPASGYAPARHELQTIPNPFFREAIDLGADDAYRAAAEAFALKLDL